MLSPIDSAPASRAPWLAASMIPGPPPVMIANPASPSCRAVSRASTQAGSSSGRRAEPNSDTPLVTPDSARNPVSSSCSISSSRSASLRSEATVAVSAPSSSSSKVRGSRPSALVIPARLEGDPAPEDRAGLGPTVHDGSRTRAAR